MTTPLQPTAETPSRGRPEVDWSRAAARMQETLPPSNPVADALLVHLTDLAAGSTVVDLACGVGQPSLVLARRRPDVTVHGVDLTAEMITRAQATAAAHEVMNARFDVMSLDALGFPDGSVDAVVSQFGFLQEGDVARSVTEMARILRPGGLYSVAAFDDLALNTLMSTLFNALAEVADPELMPDFDHLTAMADPGVREHRLRSAGLGSVHSEPFVWVVPIPSPEALWGVLSSPAPFGRAFSVLSEDALSQVRDRLQVVSADFANGDGGGYLFPITCRLFWGKR